MKKIVLFVMALMAMVINVKAADVEPTYTAKGTISDYSASYANLSDVPALSDMTVEVYGANDSIIIRNWWGVEGYDIAIITDSEGNTTTTPIVNGVTNHYDYKSYSWVDTGLAPSSAWIAQIYDPYIWINTDDNNTCGVLLGMYVYYDYDYKSYSSWGYYYISWPVPENAAISSVVADSADDNAPLYNIAGQRVAKGAKGLVIKNGKKFFNK